MNKAYGITANTFSELINKINDFAAKNRIFSTQFIEPDHNTFYCVVWYDDQNEQKPRQEPQKQESKPVNKPKTEFGKPTKKMRYRIEKTWETEDGQEFLKEIGYDGNIDELSYDKASYFIKLIHEKEENSKEDY